MREKLIDSILELAGDEYTEAKDIIELAKASEEQLVNIIIGIAQWYKSKSNA